MRTRPDQFAKNILREALSRVATAETEVEVAAGAQKIDVYSVPDPAREAERAEMGMLGELSAEPALFEPYSYTPGIEQLRVCMRKQLGWYHELLRRARVAAGKADDADEEEAPRAAVPFPVLVVIAAGRPEQVLEGYRFEAVRPGLYIAAPALSVRVIVLSELPRTRETLLLRLLGRERLMRDAVADLKSLPLDAWERRISWPLLIHFQYEPSGDVDDQEREALMVEIQANFQEYTQQVRDEGRQEGTRDEARKLVLLLLRNRFGELPEPIVARVRAAGTDDLERWALRLLTAQTLGDVIDGA